jgi:NitT/TauT family transport system substrate-binding protein
VAAADAQGADLVMIGALYQGSTFSIIARPDVKTVADLKGKKVGATQRGATTDFVIRKVAQQQGFASDVNVVYIPENAQIVAAIVSGALDAGVLSEPFTSVAINQGNHAVWGPDTPGAGDFVSMSNIIGKKSYVASHKDVLERFLKANIEANHLTKAHPDQAVPYVQRLVQMDDAKVVRQAIDGVESVLREDLSFDLSAVQSVIDSAATSTPEVGKVKPQDISDLSLVNDIKASGFLNSLK